MSKRLAAALAVALMAATASAAPAPRMAIASFDQLKTPLPYPYDEHADADAAVAAAKARALAHHKLLLIDLGGNWCPDCRILAGTMEQPELKAFVDAHYEVVTVDVGRFDKNQQIPAGVTYAKAQSQQSAAGTWGTAGLVLGGVAAACVVGMALTW